MSRPTTDELIKAYNKEKIEKYKRQYKWWLQGRLDVLEEHRDDLIVMGNVWIKKEIAKVKEALNK
jgi:hypothetical protein